METRDAPVDNYADLPSWIRPGAKLATLGNSSYRNVTVARITRTQIVATVDGNPGVVDRFDRKPVKPRNGGEEWRLRGAYSTILVRRDHSQVVSLRIDWIARSAADRVAALRKRYGNPSEDDRRSRDERALDLIDGIENAARIARRKIDALLNPSTVASAQYAQDLEV